MCTPHKAHTVIIYLETRTEHIQELSELLTNATEAALKEKDCLIYRSHQDNYNPCKFIIYETWTSQSVFLEQTKKPEVIKLSTEANKLLIKPFQVSLFTEL